MREISMKRNVLFIMLFMIAFVGNCLASSDISGYRVGEGDVLKVTVYDNPDLATTVRVTSDGTIHFPLVGEVKIDGLTVSQVAEKLAHVLAQGYIVNPQVSVFMEEFRSKKVVIMGQVKTPGLYELSGPTTLLELISKAGGLTTDAGEEATIKRKIPNPKDPEEILTVNLKKLMEKGDTSLDLPVQDGDNVFVSKAGSFFVTGQVRRPDAYKLEEGTTVIKAITMAGGFTDLAAPGKVKIIRNINGQEKTFENVSMHEPVRSEDVIVVPESFF
jgi:polysaccharide export outer membrane protein